MGHWTNCVVSNHLCAFALGECFHTAASVCQGSNLLPVMSSWWTWFLWTASNTRYDQRILMKLRLQYVKVCSLQSDAVLPTLDEAVHCCISKPFIASCLCTLGWKPNQLASLFILCLWMRNSQPSIHTFNSSYHLLCPICLHVLLSAQSWEQCSANQNTWVELWGMFAMVNLFNFF